jgi:hypothetical protein
MITSKLGWRNIIDGGRASGAGINRSQNSAKNKMQHERSDRHGDPKREAEKPVPCDRHENDHHDKPGQNAEGESTPEQSAPASDKPESVMPPGHPRIVERFEHG